MQVTVMVVNFWQPKIEREGKQDCRNQKNEGDLHSGHDGK